MENAKYRIGFIGAGGIAASRHLPNLLKIEGVKLVAVANRSVESAKIAAERFGFSKVYERWQDVANDPEVNIVFVCTPPYLHREATCYALSRGKHVFCQARMALNLNDAKAMLDADRETPLTTMLCPPPHYMAVEPYVIDVLDKALLGDIRHVVLQHVTNELNDEEKPLHWRQRRDLSGINLLDVGIMGEVLNKWFGPVDRLSAFGKKWVDRRPADKDGKTVVDMPDAVSVTGEFRGGPTFTALFSGAAEGGHKQMTIYGSLATLQLFQNEKYVLWSDGDGERKIEIDPERQGRWTVEADFLKAVDEGRKGRPSFAAGVQYMAFTQAITDSLRQDMKPVELYEE